MSINGVKILLLLKRIFNICLRCASRTGRGGSGGSGGNSGNSGNGESGESGEKISENLGKSQESQKCKLQTCAVVGMNNSKCS